MNEKSHYLTSSFARVLHCNALKSIILYDEIERETFGTNEPRPRMPATLLRKYPDGCRDVGRLSKIDRPPASRRI